MATPVITAATARMITVSGTNLFAVAAQQLGDATQWNRIAKLNAILDPFISSLTVLKLPPVNATAGNGGR